MGKTKKANSSSSTALTLRRIQSITLSENPAIELTSHSVRIGSLVWERDTFLRNIQTNLARAFILLLLLEKTLASHSPTVAVDFYITDPTGATNYRYVSYVRKELEDVPHNIIHHCHPSLNSTITAAAYSTLATVGDITAFIARGINQTVQSDFEHCMIEQMQNAYDAALEANDRFLTIFLPSFFVGIPVTACLLVCLGFAFCTMIQHYAPTKEFDELYPSTTKKNDKSGHITQIEDRQELTSTITDSDLEADIAEGMQDEQDIEKADPDTGEKELNRFRK